MMKEEKMSFVRVASTRDVAPGAMKGITADSTEILLVNLAGTYFAIGNICRHMGCRISMGTLSGDVVTCPCHGSQYNVKTGTIVRGPTIEPEPPYEVRVEDDQILVRI